MKNKILSGLSIKVGMIIIFIELIVLAVTGIYYLQRFNEGINERFFNRAKTVGDLMSKGFIEYDIVQNESQMAELIGDNLIDAMVITITRKVFYSLNQEYEGKNISEIQFIDSDWISTDNTKGFIRFDVIDGEKSLVSITPVFAGSSNKPYYYIYFRISTEKADEEKRNIAVIFLLGSIFCIILTSIAIIMAFRFLIFRWEANL